MHDVITFLKPALGKLDQFFVQSGVMTTRNESILAGMPMPLLPDLCIPGADLLRALSRMQDGQPQVAVEGDTLVLRSARLRASIRCLDVEPTPLPNLDMLTWRPCPPVLGAQLAMAARFTGELGWSAGVRLMDGRITAVCNTGGVDIDAPGLELPPSLLTVQAIEFIAKAGEPSHYAASAGAVSWRWPDGRWARCQLLAAEMPSGQVDSIFAQAQGEAATLITEEVREAFADAAALSGDTQVTLNPEGWHSAHGAAQGHASFASGLLAGHSSTWRVRALEPVLAYATVWAPGAYPAPARFEGPGFRGLVLGVSR